MSEDTATDAALERSSILNLTNEDMESEIRVLASTPDLSLLQNVSSSTAIDDGNGRLQSLDSIRENLSKQQERLSALRERALKKTEDGRRKSSISDSMESLKTLGQMLTVLKARGSGAGNGGGQVTPNESIDSHNILSEMANRSVSTPIAASAAATTVERVERVESGNEKLIMLNQRTEHNRALLEQRKRDMANKSAAALTKPTGGGELRLSMTDLRSASCASVSSAPVARHRSAADLQLQQLSAEQFDEGRLKLLKNRMKMHELKQSRREQELQQELLKLREELAQRANRIDELELAQLTLTLPNELESSRLRERNNELETINDLLESTRCELQDELLKAREELKAANAEPLEREAPSTDAQVHAELAKQVQRLEQQLEKLNEDNAQLRSENSSGADLGKIDDASIAERLAELDRSIAEQRLELEARDLTIRTQQEELAEKTTEVNVLNVNLRVLEEKLTSSSKSKPIFMAAVGDNDNDAAEAGQAELQQLKQKLDECNKSSIKLKLKCKQTEKQLEKLKSSSELHKELTRLAEENLKLQQSVTVLEDEKGQWQLSHVHDAGSSEDGDAPASNSKSELETIRLLEEQKLELQQTLQALQQGSESARVESELSEAQLEEQLSQRVQQLELETAEQREKLQLLESEKVEMDKKLSHYINENMELLDKLEKLSKSSSSAESIEIVERPTKQERDELERFNMRRPASEGGDGGIDEPAEEEEEEEEGNSSSPVVLPNYVSELTQTDAQMAPEVSESLTQLREESAELLKKIELFTTERREVLQRLEQLVADNSELQSKLELSESAQSKLSQELEKQLLISEKASQDLSLSSMQTSSEVVASLDCGEGPALFDKCEKSLSKLNSELEAYRKANDRNAKFNVSKKLAREAKNVHTQLTELLLKVKEASSAVETVTVVETVVAVTAPNGKALAEYEQLNAHNAELKAALAALRLELSELRDSYEEEAQLPAIEEAPAAAKEQLKAEQLKEEQLKAEELKAELAQLREELLEARFGEEEGQQLLAERNSTVAELHQRLEQLHQLMSSKEMSHEKQLEQMTRMRRELEGRNETLEGELSILQTLNAEQKQQLIEAYSESEHRLNMKMLDIQQLEEQLKALTQGEDSEQLQEALRVQKSLAAQQISELAEQQETIETLNQQISELYQQLSQAEQQLELSEARNKELREKLKKFAASLKKRSSENAELEQRLAERQNDDVEQQLEQQQRLVAKLNEELKAKIHVNLENRDVIRQLRQSQEEQSDQLQRQQVELQNAVKANTELRQEQLQWEEQQEELRRQLEQKSTKFEKSKEVIKQRNAAIQMLQNELLELRSKAEEEQQQQSQHASEKANFEATIARLETLHDGIQAKLQQDQTIIDALEADNAELKQRLADLEQQTRTQAAAAAEEQQQLLEQQLAAGAAQQQRQESELSQRLQALAEREQNQTQLLDELRLEADYDGKRLRSLQAEHDKLLTQHSQLLEQVQQERALSQQHSQLELEQLRQQLAQRESELQRQRNVYDAKLAAKSSELDELECDLSAHMARTSAETRELQQQLERAQEQLSGSADELARLSEELGAVESERAGLSREANLLRLQQESAAQDVLELQELRMQALQDKTEIENLRTQIEALCSNHNQLLQQLAEMDALGQNQTDDQMFMQTENKRLAEQLAELQARERARERERERERESAAAEPAALFFGGEAAAPSPFDEIVQLPVAVAQLGAAARQDQPSIGAAARQDQPSIEALQRNVSDLEKHAQELEAKLAKMADYEQLREQLDARARQLGDLERQRQQADERLAELERELAEQRQIAAIEQMMEPAAKQAAVSHAQAAPTLDMFFGAAAEGEDELQPVVEELIVPRRAYQCQPELGDWGMDEDPWAEPQPQPAGAAQRVAELEQQLASAEQEKAELLTKTAKLMRKLKEYKAKAATAATITTTTSSGGFNDLDNAIMDELKHQLELHESKQARAEELVQQQAVEKEKLMKRIDVLEAGNERMAELKERQDMDVQMYQARIRELQEKLQQLDSWSEPPPVAATTTGTEDSQSEAELAELRAKFEEVSEELAREKEQTQLELARLREETQLRAATQLITADRGNEEDQLLLQEKESEIVHLKQRIEELMREDQTEKLVFEILTKNQELQLLRMQLKQLEEEKLEAAEAVPLVPIEVKSDRHLELQLEELRLQNGLLEQEKNDMEEELRILNNHVLSSLALEDKVKQSVLELDTKNIEISELRKSLEGVQQQHQASPVDQAALNQQWEAMVEQKCGEVATQWQEYLAQREASFKAQLEQLEAKLQESNNSQSQIEVAAKREAETEAVRPLSYNVTTDLGDVAEADVGVDDMLLKMQKALETQEMEIVTLKEQLAIRSAEYARLAAQYDPFRLQNTLGGGSHAQPAPNASRDPLPEYVLKADLDYALMMLHQRDMRVEEMILELVQLLEERDHLQLKLSDTLRQLEAERSPKVGVTASSSAASDSPLKISSSSDLSTATGDLKQKLAELQTVKHSKDKALVDEREQRLQQMMQLQKDMSKSAAATTTTPAATSTTTAAQQQPIGVDLSQQPSLSSPSMVLMNWILGNNKSEDEGHQAHN